MPEPVTFSALIIHIGYRILDNAIDRFVGHVLDAAGEMFKKQEDSLAALDRAVSKSQQKIDESLAIQRRQIKMYYHDGMENLRNAEAATKKKQKKRFLYEAIKSFTSARNVEAGEDAARAAVLVAGCFRALRVIDHKTPKVQEKRWLDAAFQIAEQSLGSDGKPPRELMRQLLSLPHLSRQHGTFEVYWKLRWEPKLIEPPKYSRG